MSFYVDGVKVGKLGVLTEPPTYDADIISADMQRGRIGYAQGKKVIGTGRCFEFAEYGRLTLENIQDENGNDRYGFIIETEFDNNVLFFSSTSDGDMLSQNVYFIPETDNNIIVGTNRSTLSDICMIRQDSYVFVYLSSIEEIDTQINYFIAKDNHI